MTTAGKSHLRKVTATAPANGGWAFADGTAFGEILVYEGDAGLSLVPAAGTRPCIGVSCGDREYLFTNFPNETITIAYDALLEMEQGAALTGIYSTFWYVDDERRLCSYVQHAVLVLLQFFQHLALP